MALGVAVAVTRTNDPGPSASQAYHWGYGEAQGPDRAKFLNIKTPLTDQGTAASDCDRFLWEYANDNPVMITDVQPWHDAVNGCVDDLMGRKEHAYRQR
ncbi:hypothetical protein [Streptacidiphilus melanogenes]|uniref:hypothetical protein n=1 Tax=Streptacidiphilus melanogenes TaxID=411235 RepID=UPI0005A9ECA8|nr:hypothetical protein [Streptacidiphilus melanogenes]